MPIYTVQGPDGKTYDIQGPAGATADQLGAFIQSQGGSPAAAESNLPTSDDVLPINQDNPLQPTPQEIAAQTPTQKFNPSSLVENSLRSPFDNSTPMQGTKALGAGLGQGVGQVALGAEHYLGKGLQALGADQVGGSLVNDAATGRANLAQEVAPYAKDAPFSAGVGRIAGNMAGTAPVGGMLSSLLKTGAGAIGTASPIAAKLAEALRSGGVSLGTPAATTLGGRAADLGIRSLGGAATGAATAGLVNPDDAETGAIVGGAFPVAGQAIASGAQAVGNALRGTVSPMVVSLANRAKALGIDIPADRLTNSKPLDAIASSLNYVPFSGRSATESAMQSQMNRALSRTFGQDSDNVTMALRQAQGDLGNEFDRVLQSNTVKIDPQFTTDLQDIAKRATSELTPDQAGVIDRQVKNIVGSAQNGEINGQLAYNIKRTLDRIGNQNVPQAFYAGDLKKALMGALNRSLGPDEAQAFAKTRQQYGNMLELQKLAQNGAEGNVSIARVANLKNINNPDLQELADIAAQFLKPREGQHGSMQRVGAALGAGAFATHMGGLAVPAATAGGAAFGRALNMGLNSNAARNAVLGQSKVSPALINALRHATPIGSKVAPVLSAQ